MMEPEVGCEDCEMWASYGSVFAQDDEPSLLEAHIRAEHGGGVA